MNPAHWHLIVNHLPVVGSFITLIFLAYGILRKNQGCVRMSMLMVMLMGFSSLVALKTGDRAEHYLEKLPEINEGLVEEHEEMAEKAFIISSIAAALALLSVLLGLKRQPTAKVFQWITLCALLSSCIILSWSAKLGGEIRHPEARADFHLSQ